MLPSEQRASGAPGPAPQVASRIAPARAGRVRRRVPCSRAPGSRAPGSRAPGSRAPGSRAPGSRAPGSRAPGSRAPAPAPPAPAPPASSDPAPVPLQSASAGPWPAAAQLEMYRRMLLIRRFEELAGELYRDGQSPDSCICRSARRRCAVGVCWPLRPTT